MQAGPPRRPGQRAGWTHADRIPGERRSGTRRGGGELHECGTRPWLLQVYALSVDPRRQIEREQLVPAEADDLWSSDDNKGWNRLSITRRNAVPQLRPEDLLLPSGLGNLRMLASCAGMGLLATILYVWVPLMLVEFFVPIGGPIFVAVLASAFVTLSLGLYLWGTIETQRDRDLAGRL
jgi:hypothetical protein